MLATAFKGKVEPVTQHSTECDTITSDWAAAAGGGGQLAGLQGLCVCVCVVWTHSFPSLSQYMVTKAESIIFIIILWWKWCMYHVVWCSMQ